MAVLYSIQVLRGIACIAVVFSHALAKGKNYAEFELPSFFQSNYESIIFGHAGVDLFFVLSGFIIFLVHRNDFGQIDKIPNFIVSRLIRVVPIYWILTIVAVIVLIMLPELFTHRSEVELSWLLGSLFFIPVSTSYGVDSPVLGVGWTLNYEMFFYGLFALLLLFKRNVFYVVLITYSVCLLLFADSSMRTTTTYFDLVQSPMIVEFSLGVLAAWLYCTFKLKLRDYRVLYLLVSLSLYALSLYDIPLTYMARLLLWGSAAFFLILFALCLDYQPNNSIGRSGVRLGDISYSAYLLQVFTLPLFSKVFFMLGLSSIFGFWSYVFFITVLTMISSLIFWSFVEKQVTHYLKQRFVGKRTSK